MLPLALCATEGAEIRAFFKVGTVPLIEVAFTTTPRALGVYSGVASGGGPTPGDLVNPMVNPIPFVAQDVDTTICRLERRPRVLDFSMKDAIAPTASVDFLLVVAPWPSAT